MSADARDACASDFRLTFRALRAMLAENLSMGEDLWAGQGQNVKGRCGGRASSCVSQSGAWDGRRNNSCARDWAANLADSTVLCVAFSNSSNREEQVGLQKKIVMLLSRARGSVLAVNEARSFGRSILGNRDKRMACSGRVSRSYRDLASSREGCCKRNDFRFTCRALTAMFAENLSMGEGLWARQDRRKERRMGRLGQPFPS
jgi:hypothetical protein